jgi:glycosyltransferase involved in cell wall biosynthesis
MTHTVKILPSFRQGDIGGVARHVLGLAARLPENGWNIVTDRAPADLVHAHAIDTSVQIDVYTSHGIYPISSRMPVWQRQLNDTMLRSIRVADRVIAVSEWCASRWRELTGVDPVIIPNWIEPVELKDVPTGVWRSQLKTDESRKIVLWGKATLSDVNDPSPLLELAQRYPEVLFISVARIDAKNFRNLVSVGPQSHEKMMTLIADCDVYLATTTENHSVQVLEALALGKPILGFDYAGTGETVRGHGCAFLVPKDDFGALVERLPEALDADVDVVKKSALDLASTYAGKKIVPQIVRVYNDLLAQRSEKRVSFSIVVPVYNKEAYIGETLRSAFSQRDVGEYEVVIVNDGSTDMSLQRIEAACKTAPPTVHVKVIDKKNGGVAIARNEGITKASGEFVCCLDADDLIEPQFLSRLGGALVSDPEIGIAYSDFRAFGKTDTGELLDNVLKTPEFDFQNLRAGNFIPCCNLFRRKAWQQAKGYKSVIDKYGPSWEDYDLWLSIAELGWTAKHVPGAMFHYRKVPNVGRDHDSHPFAGRLQAIVHKLHRRLYEPSVSVVIPCFEQSRFLGEAIDSVLSQTYADVEIVVVDDGNDSEEADAIKSIVDAYPREADVRLVVRENGGLAEARNTGIMLSRAPWILPLDADDLLLPEFIEKAVSLVAGDPSYFAYSDTIVWDTVADTRREVASDEYEFDELLRRITWPCSILFSKMRWQETGGYKQIMSRAGGWEDWEFAISLGRIGTCGKHLREPLFVYRQHSANQMRRMAVERRSILQETLQRLHADLYQGVRPVACCGRRTQGTTGNRTVPISQPSATVPIRYVGQSYGKMTWRCPSGHSYVFGLSSPVVQVKEEDVDWLVRLPQFVRIEV